MSSDPLPSFPELSQTPPDGAPGGLLDIRSNISEAVNLSEKQLRAIELTTQGLTDARIAEVLSVDPKTLWRWKTLDEDYRRMLANARAQSHAVVVDLFQGLVLRAAGVLAEFLDDVHVEIRFRAAAIIVNMAGCFKPPMQNPQPSPRPKEIESKSNPFTKGPQPEARGLETT